MQIIKVKLGKRSYAIVVGNKITPFLGRYLEKLNLGNSAFVITNPLVKAKCAGELTKALRRAGLSFKIRVIPDTEKSKSIAVLSSVIRDLAKFDLKKRTFIIALG